MKNGFVDRYFNCSYTDSIKIFKVLTICQRTICLNRLLYIKSMKFTINLLYSHFIFYQSLMINLINFFNLILHGFKELNHSLVGLEPPMLPLNYIRIKNKTPNLLLSRSGELKWYIYTLIIYLFLQIVSYYY